MQNLASPAFHLKPQPFAAKSATLRPLEPVKFPSGRSAANFTGLRLLTSGFTFVPHPSAAIVPLPSVSPF